MSQADGIVQTFDETLLADAQRKTAFASERASAAFERAAKTEKGGFPGKRTCCNSRETSRGRKCTSSQSSRSCGGRPKNAEGLRLQIAQADERAANAERGAAIANLELAKVKTPRRLSEAQKVELVRLLSAAPPFTVGFPPLRNSSKETADFADDLLDVFTRMNLVPSGLSSGKPLRGIGANDTVGVVIGVMSQEQHPRAADILRNTLRAWGFEVSGEAAPNVVKRPDDMQILVGAKQ